MMSRSASMTGPYECGRGGTARLLTRHSAFKKEGEGFMRYSVALVFSVSAVGCLLPGCVAEHASAIDEAKTQDDLISQLPDKPANPADPFGSCEQDTDLPYPYFLWAHCSSTESGCYSHFLGDENGGQVWQICNHDCDNTSQCPVPITGDAAPECSQGRCLLPCDGDTVCPDGFTCASVAEAGEMLGGSCVQYGIFGPMP